MMDQVGSDLAPDIEDHYAEENPHLPEGPRRLLRSYVDAGKLGVKSGEGFYKYPDSGAGPNATTRARAPPGSYLPTQSPTNEV